MKILQNKYILLLAALTICFSVLMISQGVSQSTGDNEVVTEDGDACNSPSVAPGMEDENPDPKVPNTHIPAVPATLAGGENMILCKTFVEAFIDMTPETSAEKRAASHTEQDNFKGKVSSISVSWMESNLLAGDNPPNFRLYFGKNGSEDGVVIVPLNNLCQDDVGRATWLAIGSPTRNTDPVTLPLCTLKKYVNDYQTAMEGPNGPGAGRYVKSWTYDAPILKDLLRVKNKKGISIKAEKFLIEYGIVDDSKSGVGYDELDPIFHVKYPKGGATYYNEYADWAQPCPLLCPGERFFGIGQVCK